MHWKLKRKKTPDITEREIILAIHRGVRTRDANWEGVLNSTIRIPPSGRRLKVVYKVIAPKKYRIITAYWLLW